MDLELVQEVQPSLPQAGNSYWVLQPQVCKSRRTHSLILCSHFKAHRFGFSNSNALEIWL